MIYDSISLRLNAFVVYVHMGLSLDLMSLDNDAIFIAFLLYCLDTGLQL